MVCAALAGCGGGGSEDHPKLAIKVKAVPTADTMVDAGVGLESKATGGDPQLIDVEADPYPFGSFHRSHTVPTDANGSVFKTGDLPDVNTRYRFVQAVEDHVKSRPILVYVHPRLRYKLRPAVNGGVAVHVDVKFGLSAEATRGPVYFYVVPKGSKRGRRVGQAPERPREPGLASADFAIPPPARFKHLYVCSPTSFAKGMGRPDFPVRDCGAATTPLPAKLPAPDSLADF